MEILCVFAVIVVGSCIGYVRFLVYEPWYHLERIFGRIPMMYRQTEVLCYVEGESFVADFRGNVYFVKHWGDTTCPFPVAEDGTISRQADLGAIHPWAEVFLIKETLYGLFYLTDHQPSPPRHIF